MIEQIKKTDTNEGKNNHCVALKVAINILNKWKCSDLEKENILGIKHSTLHKYQSNPFSARMTPDLRERVSYLLNIHAALRIMFNNPENIYGFVRMPNKNYYFNGASPMDIMSNGLNSSLYEVHRQIDSLRGGQW